MNTLLFSAEINSDEGLFYFEFERQFMDAGLRCIPMCVRYKLDTVGIKLSLDVWCKMNRMERVSLATLACYTPEDIRRYDQFLCDCIKHYDHSDPMRLSPSLENDSTHQIYNRVSDHCKLYFIELKWNDWMSLTALERFALSKLLKPGHESKNFVPALKEFGLLNKWELSGNE